MLPRVLRIVDEYPEADTLSRVVQIVDANCSSDFLLWNHYEKIARFELIVRHLEKLHVQSVSDLSELLYQDTAVKQLIQLRGIGNKTIDYMAALTGHDNIAVDRHVKKFATRCDVHINNYIILKRVFSFAADLLNSTRRQFDSWVWKIESQKTLQSQ